MPASCIIAPSHEPHGFVDELGFKVAGGFCKESVIGFAINRFAPDLKHHRHRQRRYRLKRLVE
jgi:hypothetical protein